MNQNLPTVNVLQENYLRIRGKTLEICRPLSKEDYVPQPVVDISPPKWHLAHTTWFFETFVLRPGKKKYRTFNPSYGYLFNSYYETVGERVLRPDRGNITRPGVDEIFEYRNYVDKEMLEYLQSLDETELQNVLDVINLGLQHEQQHQELLFTDLKYILGHNPLFPAYLDSSLQPEKPGSFPGPLTYSEIPEGLYEIGFDGDGFCFDNEKGQHKIFLHAFEVADRLITNGEYLEFMESGGYRNFRYWLSEGWDWVNQQRNKCPLYWIQRDGKWYHYTLHGLLPVDMNEPLTHVNFYEADAFAAWRGKRLLTEFEWEIACQHLSPVIPPQANLLNTNFLAPVGGEGFHFFGDVWEWTNSAYLPYPYYSKAKGAIGEYNGKFMINQMVLKGGSCVTSKDHIRITYRNFFHPHLKWQFSGIRLANTIM
ncbi:ergothioneine biosynthesis protein EgtB [Cytophagales bacterium RKSG123]|nr:ergothioneine biosynthesis protein EgtB [Xanthovirga aplysinae]